MLTGERVGLRAVRGDDLPRISAILAEPEVASRWGQFTEDEIGEFVDGSAFAVIVDDELIGVVQYGENEDPMYRSASIDIFLTASRHRQGLGSDAVRTLAQFLFGERGHHRLTIDPAADNAAAIHAYERVGFRTVGVMRSYERGPDGTWHDGLLMELLDEELR
jgi:aminoglycoside 6'-N-acetyltransferase